MPSNEQIIATAIDPRKTTWCWKLCHHMGCDGYEYKKPPCPDCQDTCYLPNIGKHNLLDVTEWAVKQSFLDEVELPWVDEPGWGLLSIREHIGFIMSLMLEPKMSPTRPPITAEQATTEIISIIAKAIEEQD